MIGVILARLQPLHNGHLELIKLACSQCDEVCVFVGSADKMNKRNPIPIDLRIEMTEKATENILTISNQHPQIIPLDDLSDETNNTHDWGFYLYSKIVHYIDNDVFTMYYSDGFEIITQWFPGFILRNNISLVLLARNTVEKGVSATMVRDCITRKDWDELEKLVPKEIFNYKNVLYNYLKLWS